MFILDEDSGEGRVVKGVNVVVKTVGDSGAVSSAPITIDYKILPIDVSDEIINAAKDGDNDSDLIKKVVVGWGCITNRAGDVVDFSAKALDAACRQANFRSAVMNCYFRTANGERPRRGN